jgi:signal transduction histidine kinase
MFGAYSALRLAIDSDEKRAVAAAAYWAACAVPSAFLIFVFPRMPSIQNQSFHPSQTIASGGFDRAYSATIFEMLAVLLVFAIWAYRMRVAAGLLEYEMETAYEIKRRKRITLELLLLPYYFCMFAIYIIHMLDIESLKKVWKGNIYLVVVVLVFYIYIAYKEGFMGVKISFVKYDWNSEMQSINSSTQYINHMLKNHATKINWSVDSIRKKFENTCLEEFDIIERSTKQLIAFTEKTNMCLSPKMAGNDLCCSSNLIYEAVETSNPKLQENITLTVNIKDDALIVCDAQSIVEVLHNTIKNAYEAIGQNGQISIASYFNKKYYSIEITDNGIGITSEQMKQIFKPFYTTKKNNINFGVGLPYCKNVMLAHDGSIDVFSEKSMGTRFILNFPLKRIKRKELAAIER